MAREKNTERSAARRRSRAAARARLASQEDALTADDEVSNDEVMPAERPSLFKLPDVRADTQALPEMFRTRRLIWLPFALLVGGFFVALGMPFTGVDPTMQQVLGIYFEMIFLPQGLITFLIGGFLATRGAYLVGFLLGLVNAVLLVIAFSVNADLAAVATQAGSPLAIYLAIYAILVGPLAAAFAAWYRGFLNRMGESGRQRRVAREQERAKQEREARRAAKRPAKTSA